LTHRRAGPSPNRRRLPPRGVESRAELEPFLVELWDRLIPLLEDGAEDADAQMVAAAREVAVKWGKDELRTLEYVSRELFRDELAFDF
jgi:hypothetical protein